MRISIIMPPFLGDCIMTIPLINQLMRNHKIFIICNDYTYISLPFLFKYLQVLKTSSGQNEIDAIIDLLGDSKSVEFVKQSNAKVTIGFPDANYNYTYSLPLPYTYNQDQATAIYLASLNFLNVPQPDTLNFDFSYKWTYNNQDLILIAPGAGNLERCFSINSFNEFAKILSKTKKVSFILGPSEQHLAKFIDHQHNIITTNSIESTLDYISKAKLLIASEGGFMHLAAAYGIPLIGLFKIASPLNWFPYSNYLQVAVGNGKNNYTNLKCNVEFPFNELIAKTIAIYENIKN